MDAEEKIGRFWQRELKDDKHNFAKIADGIDGLLATCEHAITLVAGNIDVLVGQLSIANRLVTIFYDSDEAREMLADFAGCAWPFDA